MKTPLVSRFLGMAAVAGMLIFSSASTQASVIVSNIDEFSDVGEYGEIFSGGWSGWAFQADDNYTVDAISLAIEANVGSFSDLSVELFTSQGNNPGDLLTFIPDTSLGSFGSPVDNLDGTVSFSGSESVVDGDWYWVVVSAEDPDSYNWAYTLSTDSSGPGLLFLGFTQSGDQGASWASFSDGPFKASVSGTVAVPEPSTYALLALGLVSLFVLRRRMQKA